MHAFAKSFKFKHGFRFIRTKRNNIGASLRDNIFLSAADAGTCKRHIRKTMTRIRCPAALKLVQDDALGLFEISHLYSRTLARFHDLPIILLLCAAKQYLTKIDRPKGMYGVQPFLEVGAQYFNVLQARFWHISNSNQTLSCFVLARWFSWKPHIAFQLSTTGISIPQLF